MVTMGEGMSLARGRRKVVGEWVRIFLGLTVFSFGCHLTIFANIGLAPWDCFGMGVSYHTPLNYGLSMTVMSVVILGIDLALGERIGFGTIIDAFFTGNAVQFFCDINPLPPNESVPVGIVSMLVGFAIMAVGMKVYMVAGQCCGPRDSLFVGIGRRFPKIPVGVFQAAMLGVALFCGWVLGGPVGIGTVMSVAGMGVITQLVYDALGFDPRDVVHRDVFEVSREFVDNE